MTIGREIKNARMKKRLTQEELANKVDISRNYLSDIERNVYTPSVKKLVSLSKILDVDLNVFKE